MIVILLTKFSVLNFSNCSNEGKWIGVKYIVYVVGKRKYPVGLKLMFFFPDIVIKL